VFLGGETDTVDGHSHQIVRGTVTEEADGHTHRISHVEQIMGPAPPSEEGDDERTAQWLPRCGLPLILRWLCSRLRPTN
jgi:hypothetical protein